MVFCCFGHKRECKLGDAAAKGTKSHPHPHPEHHLDGPDTGSQQDAILSYLLRRLDAPNPFLISGELAQEEDEAPVTYEKPSYLYTSDWQRGPLGEHIESTTGRNELQGFCRAFSNFENVLRNFKGQGNKNERDLILSTASSSQVKSAEILVEWYEGHFRTVAKTHLLKCSFQKAIDKEKGLSVENQEFFPLKDRDISMPLDPACDDSEYAGGLFVLWMYEFYLSGDDIDDEFLCIIEKHRQDCIKQAVVHRLAWSAFPGLFNGTPMMKQNSQEEAILNRTSASSASCPWLYDSHINTSSERALWPCYLWDIDTNHVVKVSKLPDLPQYWTISHSWRPMQKYNEEGILLTSHMDSVPWKIPDLINFNVIDLSKMIRKLPGLLPEVKYVWMDLFCIPSENAGDEFQSLRREEIAKYSSILKLASQAILWLPHIEDWTGLNDAVCFMLLDYILSKVYQANKDHQRVGTDLLLDYGMLRGKKTTGFGETMLQTSGIDVPRISSTKQSFDLNELVKIKPASWLTDIWTLQDAILRPDMRLINKNMEQFEIECCKQIVTFDMLIALYQEWGGVGIKIDVSICNPANIRVQSKVNSVGREVWATPGGTGRTDSQDEELETGVYSVLVLKGSSLLKPSKSTIELIASLSASNLTELLIASPVDVLEMGCRRVGIGSRGEAVMASIGIPISHSPVAVGENDMLLGMYSLRFIRDVQKCIGASFFATNNSRLLAQDEDGHSIMDLRGTMLPFRGALHHRWRPKNTIDHQSVSTWRIEKDGSVYVPEAGVLASSQQSKHLTPIFAKVFFDPIICGYPIHAFMEFQDLQETLASMAKAPWCICDQLFALVLLHSAKGFEGIVVGRMQQLEVMFKIGHFVSDLREGISVPVPKPESLEWVVL